MAPLATDFAHTGIKLNLLKKIRGLKVPKITDKKTKAAKSDEGEPKTKACNINF